MSRELNSADLEAALRSLAPRPSQMDRDRLMFLAGKASAESAATAQSRRMAWPLATAASTLLALGVGWSLAEWSHQPAGPQIAGRNAPVPVPAGISKPPLPSAAAAQTNVERPPTEPAPRPRIAGESYLRLRDLVVAQGVDAWPAPPTSGSAADVAPSSMRSLRQSLWNAPL